MLFQINAHVLREFEDAWRKRFPAGVEPPPAFDEFYAEALKNNPGRKDKVEALLGPLGDDVRILSARKIALVVKQIPNGVPIIIRVVCWDEVVKRSAAEKYIARKQREAGCNTLDLSKITFPVYALERFANRYEREKNRANIPKFIPEELRAKFVLALSTPEQLPNEIRVQRLINGGGQAACYFRFKRYRFVLSEPNERGEMRVITFEVAFEPKCPTTRVW